MLLAAVDSEHDMICTIKQQAYLNYQGRARRGRAPEIFEAFLTLFFTLPKFSAQRLGLAVTRCLDWAMRTPF